LRIREHRVAAAPLPDFTSFDRVASGNTAASGALADHGIKGQGGLRMICSENRYPLFGIML